MLRTATQIRFRLRALRLNRERVEAEVAKQAPQVKRARARKDTK